MVGTLDAKSRWTMGHSERVAGSHFDPDLVKVFLKVREKKAGVKS